MDYVSSSILSKAKETRFDIVNDILIPLLFICCEIDTFDCSMRGALACSICDVVCAIFSSVWMRYSLNRLHIPHLDKKILVMPYNLTFCVIFWFFPFDQILPFNQTKLSVRPFFHTYVHTILPHWMYLRNGFTPPTLIKRWVSK